jgi:hypothetical protein
MAKKPRRDIPRLIEEWNAAWMVVQNYRLSELLDARKGRKVFRVAEVDAKDRLRQITALVCKAASEHGIDASPIRAALSDSSQLDAAFLVFEELKIATKAASPKKKGGKLAGLRPRQVAIFELLSALKSGDGLNGKEILGKLGAHHRRAESTLRRHDLPELITRGLIANTRGIGYHLPIRRD